MFLDLATIPQNTTQIDLAKPVMAYLASFAKIKTRKTQMYTLNRQARLMTGNQITSCFSFPWHLMRYEHTTALKTRLSELYKPSTVNTNISALKGVLRACWRVGYMAIEDYHRATDIKKVRVDTLPAGREASPEELKRLFTACAADHTIIGARDIAILSMLYGCGMRRAEICALSFADYNQTEQSVKVSGKGQKERFVYPPAWARSYLSAWTKARGTTPGPLFCHINRWQKLDIDHGFLTPESVHNLWKKRVRLAGLSDLTCHDMRRSYISRMLQDGVDISTVSKLAGHSNVQTTAKYDRRPEERKKAAAQTLARPGE